jgi:hypothetical protein
LTGLVAGDPQATYDKWPQEEEANQEASLQQPGLGQRLQEEGKAPEAASERTKEQGKVDRRLPSLSTTQRQRVEWLHRGFILEHATVSLNVNPEPNDAQNTLTVCFLSSACLANLHPRRALSS